MEADEGPPGEPGAQKEKTVVYQHENKPRVDQRYVLFKQMRNKVSAHSLRSHSVHFSFNAGALCQIFDSGFIFLSFCLFFVFLFLTVIILKVSIHVSRVSFLLRVLAPAANSGPMSFQCHNVNRTIFPENNGQFSVYKLHFIFFFPPTAN